MNLTIKGIPDEVGSVLKRAAEKSHRSLNGEIIHRLIRSLEEAAPPVVSSRLAEEPDRVADAWAAMAGRWKSDMSVEEEIAALYEVRSTGRDTDVSW